MHREANFYENAIGPALQSFLSLISFPRQGITIEHLGATQERESGADAVIGRGIKRVRPFYVQFKRPSAWESTDEHVGVIQERNEMKLSSDPVAMYFKLREKTKKQEDFQHNILFDLMTNLKIEGIGDAAYVCPLFLDRESYHSHVHLASLHRWVRFWRRDSIEVGSIDITDRVTGRASFHRLPVFSGHVTIPPHKKVEDAKHRYSFAVSGTDVCFHSPEVVTSGSSLLSQWLTNLFNSSYLSESKWIDSSNAREILNKVSEPFASDGNLAGSFSYESRDDEGWLVAWQKFGTFLSAIYEIDQYMFVDWALPRE